jgi:hypothetical protein
VAGLGDVDGDGTPDLGVSSVELSSMLPGNVSVFSGRDGQLLRYVRATAATEMFGVSLCAIGDVDRDGHADFATGAIGAAGGAGVAFVYRGRDGTLLQSVAGEHPGVMFTFPMAAADVNRDGYADLLIGARGVSDGSGAVFVHSIRNVTVLGAGCGDGAVAPRLSVTTPRIGQQWTLLATDASPNTNAVLLVSAIPSIPTVLWGNRCTYYLDWRTTVAIGSMRSDGSGIALQQLTLPLMHNLVGQTLAVQAGFAAHTVPIAFTNGVAATFER